MKKVFISQGMNGKTEKAIKSERAYLKNVAESALSDKVKVIDSYIEENAPKNAKPLWYLGESLKLMAYADVAIFAKDWQEYRGCKIEHEAALAYGITVIESYSKEKGDVENA